MISMPKIIFCLDGKIDHSVTADLEDYMNEESHKFTLPKVPQATIDMNTDEPSQHLFRTVELKPEAIITSQKIDSVSYYLLYYYYVDPTDRQLEHDSEKLLEMEIRDMGLNRPKD
jgi:hypothetical protein